MIFSPLLVVTDRHGARRPLTETVRAVLGAGARWVWFRDRDLKPGARRDLAVALLALVREAGGHLTIGGDIELAAEIGADGVHVNGSAFAEPDRPSHDLRMGERGGEIVTRARHVLGPSALVGLSAHSVAEVRKAAQMGADYITLSPIFSTASKPGYGPALGRDAIRAAAETGLPIMALGGIDPARAIDCRAAGAMGVAVMGSLMRADDPAAQTRAVLDALAPNAPRDSGARFPDAILR